MLGAGLQAPSADSGAHTCSKSVMTRGDVFKTFFQHTIQRFAQAMQQLRRRGVGEIAARIVLQLIGEIEIAASPGRGF